MKLSWLSSVVGVSLLAAFSMPAQLQAQQQTKPGDIGMVETQTLKPGMMKQYEDGRKQMTAWRKQQNDPRPLFVWEVLSGRRAGSYVVGRFGLHWADLDKPPVSGASETEKFMQVMGGAVESVVPRYYERLDKVSHDNSMGAEPPKLSEVITFRVRGGRAGDFRSAIARIADAAEKTKWPVHYSFYALANGGRAGTYVLVEPHPNWADLEEKPGVKPFRDMLKDAFGQAEADSVVRRLDTSIKSEYIEMIEYRPSLSYIPGK